MTLPEPMPDSFQPDFVAADGEVRASTGRYSLGVNFDRDTPSRRNEIRHALWLATEMERLGMLKGDDK